MKIIAISGYKSFIGNYYRSINKGKIKIIHFKKDINKIKELKKFLIKNKITHFINFAGLSRKTCSLNKSECLKTNYNSIKSIVKLFNNFDKKPMFIFISSSHVYGHSNKKLNEKSKTNPRSLYAKLKLKSEEYIKKHYKNYSILRLFNVFGNNQPENYFVPDIIKKIKKNQIIEIDKSVRDFIHINNVTRIINFIIKKKVLGIINIGSGRGQSLESVIKIIGKKFKKKPLLKISNTRTKIVADISFLKSHGYKNTNNEKHFNI